MEEPEFLPLKECSRCSGKAKLCWTRKGLRCADCEKKMASAGAGHVAARSRESMRAVDRNEIPFEDGLSRLERIACYIRHKEA